MLFYRSTQQDSQATPLNKERKSESKGKSELKILEFVDDDTPILEESIAMDEGKTPKSLAATLHRRLIM